MLSEQAIQKILDRLPDLHIGVMGDLFLDRYLDLDGKLTEPSVETGLDAYQVTRVRSYPGAAGTVVNNLVALGVGTVSVLSFVGQDGEGFELRQELEKRGVDLECLLTTPLRRTPTYCKPMLETPGQPPRELNRLDFKNREPLPVDLEKALASRLPELWRRCHALLVLDQVSEPECGVVTAAMRERLAALAAQYPEQFVLADSRERIGSFRCMALKPNESECRRATLGLGPLADTLESAIKRLLERCGRAVFCTRGAEGILLADSASLSGPLVRVPAYPVARPIDPVGAGDSTSAGIACAMAAGSLPAEAAAFGNLVASITIQQLGVTGTATPADVWSRWRAITAMQG